MKLLRPVNLTDPIENLEGYAGLILGKSSPWVQQLHDADHKLMKVAKGVPIGALINTASSSTNSDFWHFKSWLQMEPGYYVILYFLPNGAYSMESALVKTPSSLDPVQMMPSFLWLALLLRTYVPLVQTLDEAKELMKSLMDLDSPIPPTVAPNVAVDFETTIESEEEVDPMAAKKTAPKVLIEKPSSKLIFTGNEPRAQKIELALGQVFESLQVFQNYLSDFKKMNSYLAPYFSRIANEDVTTQIGELYHSYRTVNRISRERKGK